MEGSEYPSVCLFALSQTTETMWCLCDVAARCRMSDDDAGDDAGARGACAELRRRTTTEQDGVTTR